MKKTFTLVFENQSQKEQFKRAVENIPEKKFAEICGIRIVKGYEIIAKIYRKIFNREMLIELIDEELRCLTIYFGRNPSELTPFSPIHRNFLKLAQDAEFDVEKLISSKPKNAVKFTVEELKAFKKLFINAGWRNYLLDMHRSSPEENIAAKSFCGKILILIKDMEERNDE
ncbi:hypothetical protein KKH36_02020 [Patescibacteria group bacterium]|nr:hypothetical protein [Patescibacteria group bacterium]